MTRGRPRFWQLWLMWTLLMTLFQIGAVLRVLQLPGNVVEQISLSLPFELGISILWALVFGWAVWTIVWNHRHALRYTVGITIGFIVYSTLHRIIFSRADYDQGRIPFLVAIIVITIGIAMIALVFARRVHNTIRENASDGSKS